MFANIQSTHSRQALLHTTNERNSKYVHGSWALRTARLVLLMEC